jgi:hypothetical protein
MAAPAQSSELEFKTYTYQSGAVYEGSFRGTKRHGSGYWRHPDGETYEGEYNNNKQHGRGVYVFGKAGKQYVGNWDTGVMQGLGAYYFNAGKSTYFVGQYVADKKHGSGYYMYENGLLTQQTWTDGELQSEQEASPVDRVECARALHALVIDVRAVAPKELGKQPENLDVKNFKFPSGATYCGQFSGSKKHGQGYWAHPDGDSYEGAFEDNKHCGWGVYVSGKSGKKYVGQWTDGMMHGCGIYFFNPQETEYFVGQYRNDKKDGVGLYHFAETGSSKAQLWEAGELIKETDSDENAVMGYVAAIKKIIEVVSPNAPRYRSCAFEN